MSIQAENNEIIIISNRAPVSDFKKASVSVGGLTSALHRVAMESEGTWFFSADLKDYEYLCKNPPADLGYALEPVHIEDTEYRYFYEGYSNSLIWPLFHYFPDKCFFRDEDWEHYKNVNAKFADSIAEYVADKPDAVIWVQDYHFFLLPKYLRDRGVKNQIGFFLHTPFPTYEIFRLLPQRVEIVESLLGADLIGFHTKSYVINFFRSVRNLVKGARFTEEEGVIEYLGRSSLVKKFPISIDTQHILDMIASDKIARKTKQLAESSQGQFLGLGVDRLDYSKGILEKLKALDTFFKDNPQYIKQMNFIQIAVPSRTVVPGYQTIKQEIEEMISKINGQYGTLDWQPIIYINRAVPYEILMSYFQVADFALITPLRDGMNLVAKEFIVAKDESKGSLILSELAGAAEELDRVYLVNPYNQQQTAAAIKLSLENPQAQNAILKEYKQEIIEKDVYNWSEGFISELKATRDREFSGINKG